MGTEGGALARRPKNFVSIVDWNEIEFDLLQGVQTCTGICTQPYLVSNKNTFPGVKLHGREVEHSHQYSADFKSS